MAIELNANLVFSLTEIESGGYDSRYPDGVVPGGGAGFTGTNGETITIEGSALEALANPQPSAYDDMTEYGLADGVPFPVNGEAGARWDDNNGITSAGYEVDTAIVLPGRPMSAKALGPKSNLQDFHTNPSGPARSATHLYSTHWMRLNEDPFPPTQPDQLLSFKFARYWGASSGNSTRLSWLLRDDPKLDFSDSGSTQWWDSAQFFSGAGVNEWHRMEMEITPAGGTLFNARVYVDGKKVMEGNGDYALEAEAVNAWYTRVIGLDPSEPSKLTTTIRNWISDAWEQPTIARVELSNSPTIDTSVVQKRYFQKTLTRTEDQVQFEAYYGDLNLVDPLYAHIIRSDRAVVNVRVN